MIRGALTGGCSLVTMSVTAAKVSSAFLSARTSLARRLATLETCQLHEIEGARQSPRQTMGDRDLLDLTKSEFRVTRAQPSIAHDDKRNIDEIGTISSHQPQNHVVVGSDLVRHRVLSDRSVLGMMDDEPRMWEIG